MTSPLADRIRPQSLEDCVGQRHLLSEDKILHRLLTSKTIPNMIFTVPRAPVKPRWQTLPHGFQVKLFTS